MGDVSIVDADFGLNTLLFSGPLLGLGISAVMITSSTTAGINSGGLYTTGNSSLTGLGLEGTAVSALGVNGSLYAHAAPNTVLPTALGLTVTLNEQGTSQTASSISMFTNALHLSLKDFAFGGKLLNGDVILGHSFASITGYNVATSAPEPQAWALMIIGFGFVGAMMRARRLSSLLQA